MYSTAEGNIQPLPGSGPAERVDAMWAINFRFAYDAVEKITIKNEHFFI